MTDQNCSVCGADLRTERITYTQAIGKRVYVVEDVPAEICPQCGEQYLSPDTADAIQAVIESNKSDRTMEVPVYSLSRAS